ncbi:flagellar export chaperone FliS [Leeia sp. TBRC 13508]|uniref:Flagellar secretion chaperone FliS n=1 Tax=Leeia speluncae TaxID=2884804 RepID=A0ABS8D228_9NEIS|nr:flagellar export chaperone FliS [Leeia speluncae]MCB6182242.1 flagellar export chaperone FliS [Leeia speluncae]
MSKALNAYQSVNVNAAVLGASPAELIVMLYEGAMSAIQRAKWGIENKNYSLKSAMITKANNIVMALRAALNHEVGGELTQNLQDLYLYIEKLLLDANLKNDVELLEQSYKLLAELHSAWAELAKSGVGAEMPDASQSAVLKV